MHVIDIVIVVLYLLGLFAVGIFSRTRIKTMDDYLVAGNRFKTFSLVGTIMASLIGAGMVMGIIGKVYLYGSGMIWNYIGFAVGLAAFALFFVGPLRKRQKRTMAEFMSGDFGRLPRFLVGIFAALYAFACLAMCITGMARLLTYIAQGMGWNLNITLATVICVMIGVGLTALGGLYSVVWTDAIQFVIMIVVVLIVGPAIAIHEAGSFSAINDIIGSVNATVDSAGADLFHITRNVPLSYIIASFVLLAISVPGDPTVPQRALAGTDTKTVKRAFLIAAVVVVIFGFALCLIGGGAIATMPDIENSMYGTTEAAFPAFIMEYFPPVIAGLGIAALLSAILSTVTSMLLVGTTHLVYDAGQAIFPNIPEKTFKKMIPLATIVVGVAIIFVSLKITSLADVLYFAFSLCGGAFLLPMIATLFWKRASKWGISLGILGGGVVVLFMYIMAAITGNYNWYGMGGDPVYTALIVCAVLTVGGSLLIPGGRLEKAKEATEKDETALEKISQ